MDPFTSPARLTGELVELRPADGRDAARMHELMADPEVGRLTGSTHGDDPADAGPSWSADRLAEIYHRWAFNPRARQVYEKVGFVLEGTRRDALRSGDGWVDAHLMAVLEPDWRAARQG